MSNSFNISVAPEIAALDAKIDIIDTEVDAVRAVDLPALDAKIDIIDTEVDAIRSLNLPAILTSIGTVDTVVDAIRAVDVPNIQTNIDANETKIDTIDTVVDSIKVRTDYIPLKFTPHFSLAYLNTNSLSYVDVLNVTGQGFLYYINMQATGAATKFYIKITLDSIPSQELFYVGDTIWQHIIFVDDYSNSDYFILERLAFSTVQIAPINIHFDTSCLIQIKRADTDALIKCKVGYSVLSF